MSLKTHALFWIALGFMVVKVTMAQNLSRANYFLQLKDIREGCNIYLSLLNRIESEVQSKTSSIKEMNERSIFLRKTIEECGKKSGVLANEQSLSVHCSRDYDEWLKNLITLVSDKTELAELIKQKATLKRKLQFECKNLGG